MAATSANVLANEGGGIKARMTTPRLRLVVAMATLAAACSAARADAPAATQPAATQPAAGFRAGYARRDVTPTEPVPMWGYGARHAALSQGVLDPLHADALVIDAGGRKLAIVGLDLG